MRPSACTEFDEVAYEERWERREFAYGSRSSRSARPRPGWRRSVSGAAGAELRACRRCLGKGLPCAWVRPATSRPGRLFKASRG
jgi:hypothetical protein